MPPIQPPPRKVGSNPPSRRAPHEQEEDYDELARTITVQASPQGRPTRKGDSRAEVDLDWSDEEESTHVYGKGEEEPEPAQPPRGPYDQPSVIAPQAPMSAPSLREPSSQLGHAHMARAPEPRRSHSGDPQPGMLRETTRGARIVPPAALLTSGTAPPGPASQQRMGQGSRPGEELRSASVTESLPQDAGHFPAPQARGPDGVLRHPNQGHPHQTPAPTSQPAAGPRHHIPPNSPSFRPPPPVAIMPLAAPAQEPQRKLGMIVIALGAVIVALLAVFFLMRRTGELVVDVRDPKGAALPRAEIFVDGRKVCDSTPCVVTDLETGARLVKATAPGFQTQSPATAQIEGGKRGELTITLAPAAGTLVAKGDQPGVKVYVDGVDRGALPAKLDDVPPGSHEVRFDGGERYKSMEKVVDLEAGEVTDLGAVRLDVLRGQITIELASEDARVTIQKDQEGSTAKVVAGPFPKTIELDGGARWRVVSSKRGMPDYVARFDFADGVAVKTVRISMDPEKPPSAIVDAAPPPQAAPGPMPAGPVAGGGAPTPKEPKEPKEEPKETASGTGKVNINSIPVSRVLVDGSPRGETPLSGIELPVGMHTVTFIHPELGRKSVVVKVEAGKTATASAKLRD